MTHTFPTTSRRFARLKLACSLATMGLAAVSLPAFAGQSEAESALNRADAKIEMVTRQAGQAGNSGDQSFNMARQRIVSARTALKSGHYDTAQMLAEEASLLAALTGEKATLAALQTSHDNLVTAAAVAPAQ